jgi:hypothetical protein
MRRGVTAFVNEPVHAPYFEPRWPVALTILAVFSLLVLMPGRIMLVPIWVNCVIGLAMLVPIVAVGLTAANSRWLRVERVITLLFFLYGTFGTLIGLAKLVSLMLSQSVAISGQQMLASSIAVWVTNVLVFTLLYWQMDCGGPEARVNKAGTRPDWLFPQMEVPDAAPIGWRSTFIDYLHLSYSTATAFSTTEVAPLTSRAKMLMMLESMISLATIVIVASRAINILGG